MLTGEQLFRILGHIDPELIEEAADQGRRRSWRRAAAAACIAVLCVGSIGWCLHRIPPSKAGSSGSGIAGGDGTSEGAAFMSYAGPVFPLTLAEDCPGLTAQRRLTWDLAPGTHEDGSPRQWGAGVTDRYVLTDHTGEDLTVTAYYPFAGSFLHLDHQRPAIQVDGKAADTVLLAGAYAGGFQGVWEPDGYGGHQLDGSTLNLTSPASWRDYQALLQDGSYLESASVPPDIPDIPVTLYAFTDYVLPESAPDAATQAIAFTIDQEATTILTYGFNGSSQDTGWRQYSFFVPDEDRAQEEKYLLVLGRDLTDYALSGYADGGCDPGEEVAGISCTITRRETTLDAALELLCREYLDSGTTIAFGAPSQDFAPVFPLFHQAVTDWVVRYSPAIGKGVDRYADGRLDEILAEAYSQDRVLYLAFPVTVPAGGSVCITVQAQKSPSFDYGCSGSENVGLQGYDMVTQLGSCLDFTAQQAALVHTENIQLDRQNFGFDLARGITEVDLSPDTAHYYLEIREKKDP